MSDNARQIPVLWSLLLVAVGILLLLNNYLLLDFDVLEYWPLLLVVMGLVLLWRGDLALSWQAQTFGITRGSVRQGALEVSSGEIDVRLRALQRPGRLVAGQYTARSRPSLQVRNNRASLLMRRGQTWLFSLADWEVALARDLPWSMMVSTYLGQLDIDLRGIKVEEAYIASGFGDIRVVCTEKAGGTVLARSTFGDIRLIVPEGVPVQIKINAGPMCRILQHSTQFEEQPDRSIVNRAYREGYPALTITAGTTFGNIHLLSAAAQSIRPEAPEMAEGAEA